MLLGLAATLFGPPRSDAERSQPPLDEGAARADAICRNVVGLSPGESHYGACVDSLTSSQARMTVGVALAGARETCRSGGPVDRVALAECELNRPRQADAPLVLPPVASARPRSYFMVSNAEAFAREQHACAQVGLEPADPAFSGCVQNLDDALFAADNPSH